MIGAMYEANQQRILDVIKGADPQAKVPACPEWTITDLIRHLTGLASDVVNGKVEGYGGEEWTAAQIETRADKPLVEVVEEWSGLIEPLARLLDNADESDLPDVIKSNTGDLPRQALSVAIIGDLLHHEFDLRNACGNREDRARPDVVMSAIGHTKALRRVFTAASLPTLRVSIDDDGAVIDVGRDEPVARLRISSFEAFRTIGGRRTPAEIEDLHWEGDAHTFIPHIVLPPMRPATSSIGEL